MRVSCSLVCSYSLLLFENTQNKADLSLLVVDSESSGSSSFLHLSSVLRILFLFAVVLLIDRRRGRLFFTSPFLWDAESFGSCSFLHLSSVLRILFLVALVLLIHSGDEAACSLEKGRFCSLIFFLFLIRFLFRSFEPYRARKNQQTNFCCE